VHERNNVLYETIISTEDVYQHIDDPNWLIAECRFQLADPGRGRQDYLDAHIAGAVYVHLDDDLSGEVIPGMTGRHPLPGVNQVVNTFSNLGIADGMQVVAYDDAGGSLAAGRLWWMLRWLGHRSVAVLDGGWQKWLADGFPVQGGQQRYPAKKFIARPQPDLVVSSEFVNRVRNDQKYILLDARAPERFRGEIEPIDVVAGHIPGATSQPYTENLTQEGVFRSSDDIRSRFLMILGDINPNRVIHYCGSGVTSVHNLLAMLYAGLGESKLYVGSWSEWITDPERPVSRD